MSIKAVYGSALIQGKLTVPPRPAGVIDRSRLDALLLALFEQHDVVSVFAVAGAGKTVASQLIAENLGWPLAWLTLDPWDRKPSRVLLYLAAALEPISAAAGQILQDGMDRQLPPEEIAGLLADGITANPALIVLDQCEVLADEPDGEALLAGFLNYLPPGVRALLLGQTELRTAAKRLSSHRKMGRVFLHDLDLTPDEAAELAFAQCRDVDEVVERCRRVNGWVAAVVRAESDHFETLADEVFSELSEDEKRFLLDTAILPRISPQAATVLCAREVGRVWRLIAARHLPAAKMSDGAIELYSAFRQFLLDRLAIDQPAHLRELRRRYAHMLADDGEFERATDLYLSIGCLDEAAAAAELAVSGVLLRGDWDTVLRWLDQLGSDRANRPVLLGAKISSLRSTSRLGEARQIVMELDSAGRLNDVLVADPGVVSVAAGAALWGPRDALALLDRLGNLVNVSGIRFMLDVISGAYVVQPPQDLQRVEDYRSVSWGLMIQGRLRDLVAMLPGDSQWPPRSLYTTPHPMLGLLWRGEVERVRDLFNLVSDEVKEKIRPDVWLWFEACLLIAESDPDSALVRAERAVMHGRRSGLLTYLPAYQHVLAQALLGLGKVDEAIVVLDDALADARAGGLAAYAEWCMMSKGRAWLMKERPDAAVKILRHAVIDMSTAGRRLFLPTAAAYLCEAEWRTRNEDASDRAASLAYDTSESMGGFAALRAALREFPSVLHRQIDLDDRHAEQWRRLDVSASVASPRTAADDSPTRTIEIQPFGPTPGVLIDGESVDVGRTKVMELICYLVAHRGGVRRDDIQADLFPDRERSRGSNYFRQVVHQMRKTTGLTLRRLPNQRLDWPSGFVVDSTDARFERMASEARAVGGAERLSRLRRALDLITGPYLPSSQLEWVADRSFRLGVLQEDAEIEVADLAVAIGDFAMAADFAERILARNPSNPVAYKTLLEVEFSSGTRSGALAVYRRAQVGMADTGLTLGPDVMSRLRRYLG